MFTGIISDRGSIVVADMKGTSMTLTIDAPLTAATVSVGDSISIDGVCLTAVSVSSTSFTVDVVAESLERSTLGTLTVGAAVNLERPMRANGRFDGHIVQGHVDGRGTLLSTNVEGAAVRLKFSLPQDLARYVVEKGSIALNGISLTITDVSLVEDATAWFEVVVIPHTLDLTGLGDLETGTHVNIEVDPVAKYIERLMGERR